MTLLKVEGGASPLLRVKNITKEFSGVRVLNDVSFGLHAGEVLGLIGENGAGKSTLVKIIAGIYTPTSGKILLDGNEVQISSAGDGKALGITVIPQEFNLVKDLNVFENIFLGKEIKKGIFLNKKEMAKRSSELLKKLHSDVSPSQKIDTLSVAQKQMVEFAKALSTESRILIMDEPTTVLTSSETEVLFKIIETLKAHGVGIIYISHKLKEIKNICDRVVVLRDGNFISDDPVGTLSEHDMATRMVGRELSQIFPPKLQHSDEKILEVEGLEITGLLHNISFDLKKGEILGFAGLVGAGRTEVAEALMGLRNKKGKISINSNHVKINSPVDALSHGLSYLSEDRQGKGVLVKFGIANNVTLVSLADYCSSCFINRTKEASVAAQYVDDFHIKAASLYTNLEFFSGGNQQKVSLSKSLDTHPQILIIDEPTRGIDVNAKREIYHFINALVRDKGLSCIVISSELEEIIGLCNRVVVMHAGRVRGVVEGDGINEENIMLYATGLKG